MRYGLTFPALILALCSTILNALYALRSGLQGQLKAKAVSFPPYKHISTDIRKYELYLHFSLSLLNRHSVRAVSIQSELEIAAISQLKPHYVCRCTA